MSLYKSQTALYCLWYFAIEWTDAIFIYMQKVVLVKQTHHDSVSCQIFWFIIASLIFFLYISKLLERFWIERRKTNSQSQQTQTAPWANENSKQIHVTGAKRGNSCDQVAIGFGFASDWVGGAIFLNQSQSVVK